MFLEKDETTRREILWCLEVVLGHQSLRAAEKSIKLFQFVFTPERSASITVRKNNDWLLVCIWLRAIYSGRAKDY